MKADAKHIQATLDRFAGPDVEIVARSTGFVQRKSALNGQRFLGTLTLGYFENPRASLNDLAQTSADLGVDISAQGLDQRINEHALCFMKAMFERALAQFQSDVSLPIELVKQFNGIYLTDSSSIALPESMAAEYAGCGGSGPKASVKVQLTFEFLHSHLVQVALRAGRDTDSAYKDYTQVLEQGSLSITDLGYFSLSVFKTIITERLAYVLSRLVPTHTRLLMPEGDEIDLLALAQQRGHEAFEMAVLVGKSAPYRLPCRLLVFPVPQEVADQRRRKAKEKARSKGKTLSWRHLALLSWSFFITNAPADKLPLAAVPVLYRVRWQVELLFKLCKSYCGLKHIAGFRRERILVDLYSKLIGVVLTHFLLASRRMPTGTLGNREISAVKVRKIFRRFIRDLARALGQAKQTQDVLSQLLMRIERFGFKEKRSKRPNLGHRLALISAACGFEKGLEIA